MHLLFDPYDLKFGVLFYEGVRVDVLIDFKKTGICICIFNSERYIFTKNNFANNKSYIKKIYCFVSGLNVV